MDVLSTAVMNSVGTKLWVLFPNTEKNLEARKMWKESDSLRWFERCFAVALGTGDLAFIPCSRHHAVYTGADTLMIGAHYIVAETAARNLEILVKMLKCEWLTTILPIEP